MKKSATRSRIPPTHTVRAMLSWKPRTREEERTTSPSLPPIAMDHHCRCHRRTKASARRPLSTRGGTDSCVSYDTKTVAYSLRVSAFQTKPGGFCGSVQDSILSQSPTCATAYTCVPGRSHTASLLAQVGLSRTAVHMVIRNRRGAGKRGTLGVAVPCDGGPDDRALSTSESGGSFASEAGSRGFSFSFDLSSSGGVTSADGTSADGPGRTAACVGSAPAGATGTAASGG